MNEIDEMELFNKYEEAKKYYEIDYELFPDKRVHCLTIISALEKQIPKKPRYDSDKHLYKCPNPKCDNYLITYNEKRDYSTCCGQRLKWVN